MKDERIVSEYGATVKVLVLLWKQIRPHLASCSKLHHMLWWLYNCKHYPTKAMLEMAIVENIQRQDLNPMEIAISFQRLLDECELTQEELGEKVSKNRSTVTNFLRLLKLPDVIQLALSSKTISMGHARALLGVEDEKTLIKYYRKVLDGNLSVRKTEELVKNHKEGASSATSKSSPRYALSYEEQKMRDELSKSFASKVAISKTNKGNGKISIPFSDHAHLRKILDLLND